MSASGEFPESITTAWIASQEFPYNSLVNYIIHLLCDRNFDESDLPPSIYRLWLIRRFETDVGNGGFAQFVGNAIDSRDRTDRFLAATVPALREFDLNELESLVLKAIQIHHMELAMEWQNSLHGESSTEDASATEIGSCDGNARVFSSESIDRLYEQLDEKYGELDYDAWQLRIENYIRSHPDQFAFDPNSRRDQAELAN